MRFSLPLLVLLVATTSPVRAAEKPGWVDPPARSGRSDPAAQATPAKPSESGSVAASDARAEDSSRRTAKRPRTDEQAVRREMRAADTRGRRGTRPAPRLAETVTGMPAAHSQPARPVASEVDTAAPRGAMLAGTARSVMSEYLDAVSSRDGLQDSARFYGTLVRFHGRLMTRSALMAEKARFAKRWPERRYEPRGEARTACDAASATCVVTTPFDFQASNPARGARSAGVGELALTVGFAGDRPVILSETSRVTRRGATALADRPGNGA